MTTTYEGSITLGAAIPGAASAQAQLSATVTAAQADVQARVDGLVAVSLQPPPTLATLIASAQALLDALGELLTAPVPDVSATAAALADLQATLATLTAAASVSATLGGQLATAGIHYFLYAGAANQVGGELASHLSNGLPGGAGPNEQIAGAILLANDGGAIAALQAVLKS